MDERKAVYLWWGLMMGIAVLNFALLFYTYRKYKRRRPHYSSLLQFTRRVQMLLAAYYTLVCAFRCFLPRGDVKRIVMVDHWLSSVAIGRTLVTFAELAFVAQWALLLYEMGKHTENRWTQTSAKLIVPLIVVAEVFSWYACTTTNYFGSMIEESLWAVAAAVFIVGLVASRPYYAKPQRTFMDVASVFGFGYVLYMALVDVPAYYKGWQADNAAGVQYATVLEGLVQTATQWRATQAYEDWKYAMVWMTLYFSVAVWVSLVLVNSPRFDQLKAQNRR